MLKKEKQGKETKKLEESVSEVSKTKGVGGCVFGFVVEGRWGVFRVCGCRFLGPC